MLYSFRSQKLLTPALVTDLRLLSRRLGLLQEVTKPLNCELSFPLKAVATPIVIEALKHSVTGASASSLFEARVARQILGPDKEIHLTSPGIRPDDIDELAELCDHISFNSLSQLARFRDSFGGECGLGLRVNTELALVHDRRFDPSRVPSKLGVPISTLRKMLDCGTAELDGIEGLLIHSNCESEDFRELMATVEKVSSQLPELLGQCKWINLGGGYLFDESTDWTPFQKAVELLTQKYNLSVYFEPGRGLVGQAGFIVSSVLDIFDSGDKKIAVLDTTVNHMPEVFEYQWKPPISEESPAGPHSYLLAGSSCLAGDVFGEYSFDEPLDVGSRLVFEDMGAYTLVKANMFNGINLPAIYVLNADGEIELIREFDYQDFLSKSGVTRNATVRERVLGPKAE